MSSGESKDSISRCASSTSSFDIPSSAFWLLSSIALWSETLKAPRIFAVGSPPEELTALCTGACCVGCGCGRCACGCGGCRGCDCCGCGDCDCCWSPNFLRSRFCANKDFFPSPDVCVIRPEVGNPDVGNELSGATLLEISRSTTRAITEGKAWCS